MQGHAAIAQPPGSSPPPISALSRACRAQFCPTGPLWLERAGHNRKVSSGAVGARVWRGGKPVYTCDKPEAQEQSGATPERLQWQPSDRVVLSHETVELATGNQGAEQHKVSGQTVYRACPGMTLATRVVGQRQRACRKLRPCERKERKLLPRTA